MNCGHWEERIALHLGGDLSPAESAEVGRHVAECPGCQVFASGLKETMALVKEVHRETIADAHYAAVRARVIADLRARPWRWWQWGLAGAVAAALIVLAVWPRLTAIPTIAVGPLPAPKAPALVAATAVPPLPRAPHPRVRVRRPKPAPHQPAPEFRESIVVKLETSDPNVIIYWITEKGRGE